ncbi:hypothetical protein F8388_016696 [Cannabis sativa]|uniref:Uncharacterized protein n=1 Tax=Cannabis sativa TaxID=3483 RepID=A0A7J6GWH1_CANSA|nr:hypothetical protein F8388_016696 [Cannabis sativa]
MSMYHLIFFIWVLLSSSFSVIIGSDSWCPHQILQRENQQFEQKTDRFWEFKEETNTWVEVRLPFDLVSCVEDNCTKVGSIRLKKSNNNDKENQEEEYDAASEKMKSSKDQKETSDDDDDDDDDKGAVLPLRKRISLTKMSETSVWITSQSGCIYERFWNGVQWVVAPHDLPISEGHAASIFIVNHTILALSESGYLYQMQLNEISQPIWLEFVPTLFQTTDTEIESSRVLIKAGVVSHDGERVYFCTRNGTLLELAEIEPTRWVNHGQPPGADVAAVADAGTIRKEVVYTISSIGNLYEYDRNSKPLWKKHIWKEGAAKDASLEPLKGAALHGLIRDHSISLFLLTKGGILVERRLNQRKWKWLVHGSPKNQHLSSITHAQHEDSNEKFFSLFFTTSSGSVFEYRIPKRAGNSQENQMAETWVNHMHPPHAKAARGIGGLQFQVGRIVFPLDDGRLAELHISGIGGDNVGPINSANVRRKSTMKYVWSVLDAPETEGWNAEYCTEERGPTNCIMGIRDEPNDLGTARLATRRRKGSQQDYLIPSVVASDGPANALDKYRFADNWIERNFRLRVMQGGRSFFLITDGGFTFEYLYTEHTWIWLRHDYPAAIKGAVGNYNGSLYVIDTAGSLLIRERSGNQLAWINCTAFKKGGQVTGGPPWDGIPGRALKVTPEDALFFVSKNGRLLQFTVALRKFKWKDCQNPPNTRVACIIDQELFRENIVFVVGTNGRLYQYNKVTDLWHEHYQSQHLILSRLPGTAMRPSSMSLTGSLFMLSEDGGLVEYHWNSLDGWNWVEHGAPHKGVTLVGSPGPSFEGNQLFLISSDGNVYLRYVDQTAWKWKNCGFPYIKNMNDDHRQEKVRHKWKQDFCVDEDFSTNYKESEHVDDLSGNCDPKIASIRPIPFSEDSVIFELRDGRLGELKRVDSTQWTWSRTIGTPTSLCMENYWTALAS